MEFLLLGPLEVRLDGKPLPLGPRRAERCLLGLLLLEARQIVSAERLCDLLWDGAPPDNASSTLQTHVSRLRARLDPKRDGGNGFRLLTHGYGYQAEVSSESVDALRFRRMLLQAKQVSDPRNRSVALRDALQLWRGPILADVATDRLRDRVGTGLTELRLDAWEECMEAELAAGRHREIIPELNDLIAANPLRERLTHALMLALYTDGQQSAALEVFSHAREAMAERTGLDVGPRLTALQEAILRDEVAITAKPAPRRRIPRQLPPDVSHFVGRKEQLEKLTQLARQCGRFLTIAAIHGPGGTGKSALATRAAHSTSDEYPDGQFYLDLQGATPGLSPLRAQEGLERWLRALGMDNRVIPTNEAEAAAAFRDLTSSRHMIFLLDNAHDAAQVKPLLPSNPECFVIVTSRTVLPTLDNATHIPLDLLSEEVAVALMGRFDPRAEADKTVAHIVRRCGYLPLAIRIAGARLAARPEWTLDDLKNELDREHARLDVLQVDDLSVRASIKVGYDALGSDPLARIGRLDFVDLTKPVLDSLLHGADKPAEHLTATLVEHQLLLPTANGRFGIHDLVRDFARERGRQTDDEAPIYRVLDYYVAAAAKAHRLLYPGSDNAIEYASAHAVEICLDDADAALSWIDAELSNISSVVRQATGLTDATASLAIRLVMCVKFPLADMIGRWNALRDLADCALTIAKRIGDAKGEAESWFTLSMASRYLGTVEQAIDQARTAIRMFRDLADAKGEAYAYFALSNVHRRQSEWELAADYLERGVAISQEAGLRTLQANLLDNLGTVFERMGQFKQAIKHHEEGLRIRREENFGLGIAASLENLAWTHLAVGDPLEARPVFEEAAKLAAEVSYIALRAGSLWGLGMAQRALGDVRAARTAWAESIAICSRLGLMEDGEAERLLATDDPDLPSCLRKLRD